MDSVISFANGIIYDKVTIGIDLGTTNCCVAVYRDNDIKILTNELESITTPSYVLITDDEITVGVGAKKEAFHQKKNVIYDSKRMIGKKYSSIGLQTDIEALHWPFTVQSNNEDNPIIHIENLEVRKKDYLPEEISSILLKKIKKFVEEKHLKRNEILSQAVITIPACFTENQIYATKKAAEIAGLKILSIIPEPVAAGLGFCYHQIKKKEFEISELYKKHIMVFDLGGGTFDVTILRVKNSKLDVIALKGSLHLGGDDFTSRFVDVCVQKFKQQTGEDISHDENALARLKEKVSFVKEELSYCNDYRIHIPSIFNDTDFDYMLRRSDLENCCQDLFDRVMEIVDNALNEARLKPWDIYEVVLAGGSSQIPKIQEMLMSKRFRKLNKSMNGAVLIAYGAAVKAGIINGEINEIKLAEVTNYDIGIKVKTCKCKENCQCSSEFINIIPQNSRIPATGTKIFKIVTYGQQSIKLEIVEKKLLHDKHLEYTYIENRKWYDILSLYSGKEECITTTFALDLNGILHSQSMCTNGNSVTTTIDYKEKGSNSKHFWNKLF